VNEYYPPPLITFTFKIKGLTSAITIVNGYIKICMSNMRVICASLFVMSLVLIVLHYSLM